MVLSVQQERQGKIVNLLKSASFLSITELVEIVNYSEATIKRDLIEIEKKGLIRRVRGGAMIVDRKKIDIPYLMKIDKFNEDREKEQIADIASNLIKDDMVLFIDSSSTALHLVNLLNRFDGLQIITNGIITASLASEYTNAKVNIIGGSVVSKRFTINGSKAFNDILTYHADISFMSCRGYDFNMGATETTEGEAFVKQAIRKQSKKTVLMFTDDKVNHKFLHQSLENRDIDYIITNKPFTEEQITFLDENDIKLLY